MTDFRHAGSPAPFASMADERSTEPLSLREQREAISAMRILARTAQIAEQILEEQPPRYGKTQLFQDISAMEARLERLRKFLRAEQAAREAT
jgi:hypothetical protein